MMDDITIRMTTRAAHKINEFSRQGDIDPAMAIRLAVIGGASSGVAYDLYFDQVGAGDRVFESEGIRIVVRNNHVALLSGSTVDWVESDNGAGFQVHNPQMADS